MAQKKSASRMVPAKKTAPKKSVPAKKSAAKPAPKKSAAKPAPKKSAAKPAPKKSAAKSAPKKSAAKSAPSTKSVGTASKPNGLSTQDQRKALLALAAKAGLGHLATPLEASIRPSIRLSLSPGDAAIGASRFGGLPDLPAATPWPDAPKNPLSFMAQIDLAVVAALDEEKLLPKTGLLSFFWDAIGNAWGLSHKEASSFRVVYTPPGSVLERRKAPKTLVAPHKYAKVMFDPHTPSAGSEATIPFVRTDEFRSWGTTEKQAEVYWDEVYAGCDKLWPGGGSPYHRMLGHADGIQGDMTRRMSYLLADKYAQLDEHPIPELEADARNWRLLLQVDTDEHLKTHWGGGRLYYWIRKQDLALLRFDRAWFQFQQ